MNLPLPVSQPKPQARLEKCHSCAHFIRTPGPDLGKCDADGRQIHEIAVGDPCILGYHADASPPPPKPAPPKPVDPIPRDHWSYAVRTLMVECQSNEAGLGDVVKRMIDAGEMLLLVGAVLVSEFGLTVTVTNAIASWRGKSCSCDAKRAILNQKYPRTTS